MSDRKGVEWCREIELNYRHMDFQSIALPLSYRDVVTGGLHYLANSFAIGSVCFVLAPLAHTEVFMLVLRYCLATLDNTYSHSATPSSAWTPLSLSAYSGLRFVSSCFVSLTRTTRLHNALCSLHSLRTIQPALPRVHGKISKIYFPLPCYLVILLSCDLFFKRAKRLYEKI